eukprot:5552426-Amphidinium_carterae.3
MRAEARRLSSMQAFVQFEQQQQQALRNAHLRQPQHLKDHVYSPGSKQHEHAELRGSLSNTWIHSGGRLILVGLRQLRPAAGEEQYVPSQQDWDLLEELRRLPGPALATHLDEVATPAVGTDEPADAEPEELDLPDPLFIDGLGMPGQMDDIQLPQRVPAPSIPLPGTPVPGTPVPLPGKFLLWQARNRRLLLPHLLVNRKLLLPHLLRQG